MRRRIIVTENQLKNYVNYKKDNKVFYEIVEAIYRNNKNINENMSKRKINQTIIDYYDKIGLLTESVVKMLGEHGLTDKNNNII